MYDNPGAMALANTRDIPNDIVRLIITELGRQSERHVKWTIRLRERTEKDKNVARLTNAQRRPDQACTAAAR
jgi:hypothetical protein